MSNPTNELEHRLRSAVQAETAEIHPSDGSLDSIRTRVRSARRRRRAALAGAGLAAALAVAVVVPRLGDTDGTVDIGNQPGHQTTTSEPSTPSTTVAPAPPTADLDQALWPDPAGDLFTDPVDAARSFVVTVIGVDDPPLSAFLEGEPGAGEVEVFGRGEDGGTLDRVVATVSVRQLDGEHWFVTAAGSTDVQIDAPEPLAGVSSPVHVEGRGHGFEGTIGVELHGRSSSAPALAENFTTAGSGGELEPFAVDLDVEAPAEGVAILVAHDTEVAVPSFSAQVVRLAATSTPGTSGQTTPSSGSPPPASAESFGYQPLWPFRTQADADAWRDQYQAQGSQPWHLDAEQTALSFTTGYLGFTEIDRVVARDIGVTEAHVSVGYATDGGQTSTAANIHLVRFGSGADAPWEVVGTADTDLTLETPGYGATVSSPITVGGHVTGIDENLVVRVHQPSSEGPIGESPCCLPAGGERMPWQTTVSFAGATDPALTIVVWTGGHVQDVERFAITGVNR
jgi:Immunoglobulin-like domain of bacterial spore germination